MYARDAAVKFNPIPPQVIVASNTAIPGLSRKARRTFSRPAVDRLPSRRTHRIDLLISAGWSRSKVLVQLEKTTLMIPSLALSMTPGLDVCLPFGTFCEVEEIFDNSLNLRGQLFCGFVENRRRHCSILLLLCGSAARQMVAYRVESA